MFYITLRFENISISNDISKAINENRIEFELGSQKRGTVTHHFTVSVKEKGLRYRFSEE